MVTQSPREHTWLWLAAGLLLCIVAADVLVNDSPVVLSPLFSLAPLVACAATPVRPTATLAVASIVSAAVTPLWNLAQGLQYWVRLIDVVAVSLAAVGIAAVRQLRERHLADLAAVSEVAQRAILPVLPELAGPVAVASRYQSAAQGALVGGDLFDCYHTDRHTRFVVGDVRGKGIAGVEQAARVIRVFRQSAATRDTLSEVAEEMDEYLKRFFTDEEFVTVILVEVIDPTHLSIVRAGHPHPALLDARGQVTIVETPGGLPLGLPLTPGLYPETELAWSPGERLLLYTDGLSEARDSHGRFLEVETLAAALSRSGLEQALDAVLDAVTTHVPPGNFNDDLALVLLQNVAPVDATSSPGSPLRGSEGAASH